MKLLLAGLALLAFLPSAVSGQVAGTEFQVNTHTTSFQKSPAAAADGNGDFVVVWQSLGQDGSSYGVFGQRFNAAGFRRGSEFQANTYVTSYQSRPAVASDGNGNANESINMHTTIVVCCHRAVFRWATFNPASPNLRLTAAN